MHAIEPSPRVEDSLCASIIEAFDHGRDGHPRWICVDVPPGRRRTLIKRTSAAAEARGYVPISIDAYWVQAGNVRDDQRHRTLLLNGGAQEDRSRMHATLLDAAARSPRPHVLLTVRPVGGTCRTLVVREARPAPYGVPHRAVGASPDVARLFERTAVAERFAQQGRHAAAERLLREIAASLTRRGAEREACRVTLTLARLLLDRGRPRPASDACDDAARLAQAAGDNGLVVGARLCQAEARIGNAAFVEAEGLCRAALAGRPLESSLQLRARVLLALTVLRQHRVHELPDACDVGDPLGDAIDPRTVAEAYGIWVRIFLASGRIFEAGQMAGRLLELDAARRDVRVEAIARGADLAVLAAAGNLARARDALAAAVDAARRARLPLAAAFARLDWIDALRRAHRDRDAARELERLRRLARRAPNLLKREIAMRDAGDQRVLGGPALNAGGSAVCVALVRLAQAEGDDLAAVQRLLARLSAELQASRGELLTADAGPAALACSVGEGLHTRIGPRVLETALPIGPEREREGHELGVPIRLGARPLGALVCRWALDASTPAAAHELMDLAAAVIAPRLDAWLSAKREEARSSVAVPELVGTSSVMAAVRKAIVRAAAAPFAVLMEGESGVGKELAARAIHHLSARRERRFCDINCAALPDDLIESELFGHARGAFSGAVADRAGLFEEADGGTLLLDEVADLSARAQAKLLRVIQQQEVRRVGETFSRKVDVRIVAAANRDMRGEAAAGRFRQDLLYRLDVVRITIPPLRERPEDIAALAVHCWTAAAARVGSRAQLSPAVLRELTRYSWPGNVRELQNVLASIAVGAPRTGWVKPSHLPSVIGGTPVCTTQLATAREQFERRFIETALARAGGNRARAARCLGVSRQGLVKTLARLGIDQSAAREQC